MSASPPRTWEPEIKIVSFRLDNGLTLLVLPDHHVPVVSLQLHYRVGSRHELPGITGISHLFEHLMFRGTEELGPEEFSRILQAKGGEINAFTTKDHTSYFENLPAEHLELAVRLEADRLKHLMVEEQLYATAYTQHPYQWPVIGRDQDLRRLTLADCHSYYRTHYHAGNLIVVVAGDVDPEAARDLMVRYFGDIPNPGLPESPPVVEPPQRGERRAIFKKVSQVEAFFAGFHIVGLGHPDIYPLTLLAVILSTGKSSRFYQEFVRTGRAAEMEADLAPPPWSTQDPDLLVIRAVAAPGNALAALEADVWSLIETLKKQGVKPEELARAKKMVKSQVVQALSKNFYRGLLVGLFHLKTGDASQVNLMLRNYEAVDQDDLRRVAQTYLREDNRTVVTLKPVSPEESQSLGPLV